MGPDSVNTLPEPTIEALLDHGTIACTVDQGVDEAAGVLARLEELGIDMADVSETLETQGVASFRASFDDLVSALREKAATLRGAA